MIIQNALTRTLGGELGGEGMSMYLIDGDLAKAQLDFYLDTLWVALKLGFSLLFIILLSFYSSL